MEPDRSASLVAAARLCRVVGVSFSPRVLHVIPSIAPHRGGPSAAILPMVRELNAHGARAEIATTDDGLPPCFPTEQISWREGVPVRFFSHRPSRLSPLRKFGYAAEFKPWLQKHLRDYDLVHVHGLFSYLPSMAMHLAGQAGVPYLNRPLGMLGRWPLRQSRGRKSIYYRLCERKHLRRAGALHLTSSLEEAEMTELLLPTRTAIIPHGVALPALIPQAGDLLRKHLGLPARQKIVLYLGRLHSKKGFDLLLAAFASIDQGDTLLLLAGAGEPEDERQLRACVQAHGLADRIMFSGFVTGKRKQLFLQGADLFVLPSRHENFGLAVLEALAAGTRVLISDRIPFAEEVAAFDLGQVVGLNVPALQAALVEMLRQPPGSDENRQTLRDFVATRYSWEANARALLALYSSLLNSVPISKKKFDPSRLSAASTIEQFGHIQED